MAENDFRLLKMYSALLDNSNNANVTDENISKYCQHVHKIDTKMYKNITAKMEDNGTFMDYPLERQLEFLLELEKDYNNYFDFQEEVKRICKKNNIDIKLSDIRLINIDEIRKRINSIKKYLDNVKLIGINNDTLGSLNEQLIELNNSEDTLKKIIDRYDETLRHKIQIVSGRVKVNDKMESASISDEASKLDLDLDKLLNDSDILNEELVKAETESKDASEQLKLTVMCNTDNKYQDLYLKAYNEDINKKYKHVFLKIISLISNNSYNSSYEKAKEKRLELVELIKNRIKLLKELNVIFLFDPFNNLEIDKQLKSIEPYSNLEERIREIVNRISIITIDNDRLNSENNDFIEYFKEKIELLLDETTLKDIVDENNFDFVIESQPDNKVISVVSIPDGFVIKRAIEKAMGVINRVLSLMDKNVQDNSSSVIPNLVIEQKTTNEELPDSITYNNDSVFVEEQNTEPEIENNLFLDLPSELGVDQNNSSTVFDDNGLDINFVDDLNDNNEAINIKENISSGSDENLFSELSPFDDDAKLFEERTDNGISEEPNFKVDFTPSVTPNPFLEHIENASSDTFWTTKSDVDSSSNIPIESS